jgi:3-methylfumaryl-CoA hydratase
MDEAVARRLHQTDRTAPGPVERLAACLGLAGEHAAALYLPPLWHWLFFLDAAPRDALRTDGHRADEGLIAHDPELPARMWAGGRLRFHQLVPIHAPVWRDSRLVSERDREGRSGRLRFVTVLHRIAGPAGLMIEEEQDIVLLARAPGRAAAARPGQGEPPGAVSRVVTPDEIMLFRFSALTFNAHRIHYDAPYATAVEHYPGLVVHGPLQAMLLADHAGACVPGRRMIRFDFRAEAPAFCGRPLHLAAWADGERPGVWHAHSRDPDGVTCISAEAEFETEGYT